MSGSISMNKRYGRIVLLVDMDCFFCQVEEKLDPSLKGKPVAVVQYNEWRGGGIIAVNYAARSQGVTRHMRGDDAKEKCPEIVLVKVPSIRDKANLHKYRNAGQEVALVLQRFTDLLFRASVDEAYMDITQAVHNRFRDMNEGTYTLRSSDLASTYAVGFEKFEDYMTKVRALLANPGDQYMAEALSIAQEAADLPAVRSSDLRLVIAATIANEVRAAVKAETGYECSAGIAHNKILAKLACGINKPNKQTILPLSSIPELLSSLPIGKITGLGGKFGEEICRSLGVKFVGELRQFTEVQLQNKFDEKNGTWLYNLCRGIDLEPVVARFHAKSIGCSKKFPGQAKICATDVLSEWLFELADELCNRLDKDTLDNNRKATQLVVSYVQEFEGGREVSSSRSTLLGSCEREGLSRSCIELIKSHTKPFLRSGSDKLLHYPIKFLGISAGKFESNSNASNKLKEMFANQAAKKRRSSEEHTAIATATATTSYGHMPTETATSTISHDHMPTETESVGENESKISSAQQGVKAEIATKPQGKNFNANKATPHGKEPLTIQKMIKARDNRLHTQDRKQSNGKEKEAVAKERVSSSEREHTIAKLFSEDEDDSNDLEELLKAIEGDQQNRSNEVGLPARSNEVGLPARSNEVSLPNKSVLDVQADQLINAVTAVHSSSDRVTEPVKKRKYFHVQQTQLKTSVSTADYRSTYAEYAVPEVCADLLQYTTCELCDARILADERSLQTHQDFHYAQQLGQQLREELRTTKAQQPTKPSPRNPKKKSSSKTSPSPSAAKTAPKITTFFKSPITTETTTVKQPQHVTSCDVAAETVIALEENLRCDKCQASVSKIAMAEHLDFHVAKDLQRQLNRLDVRTVIIEKKSNSSAKSARSALSSSQLNARSAIVTKPIKEFFSQPNV